MATITRQPQAKRRTPIPYPDIAGMVVTRRFTFVVDKDVDYDAEILEVGALPARCVPVGCKVEGEGLAAGDTLTAGLMTGEYQSTDTDRISGTEFCAALAGNSSVDVSQEKLAAIAPTDACRGIGVKLGQDVNGAATKKVHVLLSYVAA